MKSSDVSEMNFIKKIGHITIPEVGRIDTRDFFQVDVGHQHHFLFSEDPYLPVKISSVDNLTRKMFSGALEQKPKTLLMYCQVLKDLTISQFLIDFDNQDQNCNFLVSKLQELVFLVAYQGIGLPQIPLSISKNNIFFITGKDGNLYVVRFFWINGWYFRTEEFQKDLILSQESLIFLPIFSRG